MSCLQQKQTSIYNLIKNSKKKSGFLLDDDNLSNSNSIEDEVTSTNFEEDEQFKYDLNDNFKLKLRNSPRLQNKTDIKLINKSTSIKNLLFDQLIEHAKKTESTDFELSFINQFCNDNLYNNLNNTNSIDYNLNNFDFNSNDKLNNLNKINLNNKRSINYLELDTDRTEFKNIKLFNNQHNMESSFNLKENQYLKSKELDNLKTSFNQNNRSTKLQIKPINKIFLNDNMFKFNDGLVNTDNLNFIKLNDLNNNFKTNRSINQINNYLFKLKNKSNIFQLFTFQDDLSTSDLENENYQTSIIALIELEQLNIWTKLNNQTEWLLNKFKLDHNQQVFRCIEIDKENFVCIFLLIYSQNLISLKYCLIDKKTKEIDFKHVETFESTNRTEISNQLDLNLIQLCFINPCSIVLSIPRNNDDIIDVLCYDNVFFNYDKEKELLNKDLKRIIYTLNNFNNKFSSSNNCFLSSDELDNIFLAIFNQRIFMCNLKENKLPKMISLKKYSNPAYSYFDVLYDKGIFYLFAGNMFKNYVRVLALNIERCLAEKLIKYDIDKQLNELRNQSTNQIDDNEFINDDDEDNRIVKLFKRIGDHLLIAKNDNTIILYNLSNDGIVYHTKLFNNIDDISIAVLEKKTKILAVLNNQFIVDIVDL